MLKGYKIIFAFLFLYILISTTLQQDPPSNQTNSTEPEPANTTENTTSTTNTT